MPLQRGRPRPSLWLLLAEVGLLASAEFRVGISGLGCRARHRVSGTGRQEPSWVGAHKCSYRASAEWGVRGATGSALPSDREDE